MTKRTDRARGRARRQAHPVDLDEVREEGFRRAFADSPVGMALTDTDGRFLLVNAALCSIAGYSADELIGRRFQEITHPQDLQANLDLLASALAGERRTYRMRKRYIAKDGQVVWIALSVAVVRDAAGEPLYLVAQMQDVTEQRQAEESLRESEARSRVVLDNLPDFVVRLGRDGTYLDVSGATEADLLIPAGDHLGKRVHEVLPPELARPRMETIERALETGEPQVLEYRLEIKGSVREREDRVIPLENGEALVIVRDVSDRKRSEEALRRRDAILEAVSEAAGALLEEGSDDRIEEALGRLGRAAQVSRAYICENRFPDAGSHLMIPRYAWAAPGFAPKAKQLPRQNLAMCDLKVVRFERALSRGEAVYGNILDFPGGDRRKLTALGIQAIAVVPVFAGDEWWGTIGFHDCVTERDWAPAEIDALSAAGRMLGATIKRRRMEDALRASEARKGALIAAIPDLMFLTSGEGVYLDYKEASDQPELSLSPDEFLGRKMDDVLPPALARASHQSLRRALETGEVQTLEYELPIHGVRRTFEARFAPGEDGNVVIIARNITQRRRADEERELLLAAERAWRAEAESARRELAAQNERLLELDRVKDEFVATVSHELRTPLTSIIGYLELLLDESGESLGAQERRFLSIVQRNAHRLLAIAGDLLFVAQLQEGRFTLEYGDVDLPRIALECGETLQPRAEAKGVELTVSASPVPSFQADGARLAQLLDNLVSNAIKFTPRGGRVKVEVGRRKRKHAATLAVSDTGVGIPLEEQEGLFERFFRTSTANRQAVPGIGLGLTIVKAIVDGHGGAIAVESREGAGTTFRVELPFEPPDPVSAEAALSGGRKGVT